MQRCCMWSAWTQTSTWVAARVQRSISSGTTRRSSTTLRRYLTWRLTSALVGPTLRASCRTRAPAQTGALTEWATISSRTALTASIYGLVCSSDGSSGAAFCVKSRVWTVWLPDKRDSTVTGRLRHAKIFEPLPAGTNKCRNSFIPYCLLLFHFLLFRLIIDYCTKLLLKMFL